MLAGLITNLSDVDLNRGDVSLGENRAPVLFKRQFEAGSGSNHRFF
jgi:hypothetical protein